jgi:hypothetical protein
LEKAILLLRDGRIDEAIPNLKLLLVDPDYSCRAAFYLFAFDGAKDEYISIIRSETCKHKTPGEAKLLEKHLQLKSEYNEQQSRVSDLRKETQNLEKELSRLRFELQKMEEIRRETGKRRIQ